MCLTYGSLVVGNSLKHPVDTKDLGRVSATSDQVGRGDACDPSTSSLSAAKMIIPSNLQEELGGGYVRESLDRELEGDRPCDGKHTYSNTLRLP